MSFGAKIKALRRGRDMTQEELAEIFSVSPQAISRWETDSAMPDISLIPTICNLFDVTSDYLLGIDVANKNKQIQELLDKAQSLSSRGYLVEAKEILREGIKKYPDNYAILRDFASVSFSQYCLASVESERDRYASDTIQSCETILNGCIDDKIRHSAIQLLCLTYPDRGKRDRARELAEMMPFMAISRDFLVSHVETGDKKYDALMNRCFMLLQFLANDTATFNVKLDSGKMAFTTEERIVMRDKSIALIHLFFENGDYGFFNTILQDAHSAQAWCYAKKLDRDNTLSHLKSAAESAIAFVEYVNAPDFKYSSLVFRGMEKGSFSTNGSNNHALSLLNKLSDGCYDFVRGEPEFTAIEDKLKEYAGKWEPDLS